MLPRHELAQSHGGTNKTINLTHGPKIHLIWTVDCCHEEPQTKPTKKLSITDGMMISLLQAYVGLGDDDPNNIWLEEEHLKQLLDCWLHICVEAQACLVLPSTSMQQNQLPECSQLEKNCADSCPSSACVGMFSVNG